MPRSFDAVQSVRGEEPLLIGLVGPPGGGKTVSALRLALGMQRVRKGPIVLIDTEGGRSKKYSPEDGKPANPAAYIFDFKRVDFTPPFQSQYFLQAIQEQLKLKPACIIVDTASDEHEGEGGYLEWHDEMVEKMGGNEWAAWAKPKAARKRLTSGLLQIKVPLILTFRAREKTAQKPKENGKRGVDVVNIGWMPVAPLEIVHALDLTCILPPRANGVPVWTSEKVGEDFIVKLPEYLKPLIQAGALNEGTGEALARWAAGAPPQAPPAGAGATIDTRAALLATIRAWGGSYKAKEAAEQLARVSGGLAWAAVQKLDEVALRAIVEKIEGTGQAKVAPPADPPIDQDQVFEILGLARAAGIDSARLPQILGCQPHQLPASRFEEVKAQLVGNTADVPDQPDAQPSLDL